MHSISLAVVECSCEAHHSPSASPPRLTVEPADAALPPLSGSFHLYLAIHPVAQDHWWVNADLWV